MAGTERKRWLETLLDRMSAPAAVMRQHLGEGDQKHALGSAAETGVRDLLRLVLPQRLTVASGFVREPGRTLAASTPATAVSSQTDVIIYDGTTATPLLSLGEVQIVAAPDVLGVIEVKDTDKGSEELGKPKPKDKASKQATPDPNDKDTRSNKKKKKQDDNKDDDGGGALGHTAGLAILAPNAFRAIILFRGKESKKGKGQEQEDELEDEELEDDVAQDDELENSIGKKKRGGSKPMAEIERAQKRIRGARLGQDQLPHLIYCASYAIPDGAGKSYEGSYLAFHNFRAQAVHIHEYHRDPTRALASFLRIMTGFFAVRGMISPSLHLDLVPTEPDEVETVKIDAPSFQCLHKELLTLRGNSNEFKTFFSLFVEYLRTADNVVSKVVTGCDAKSLPTTGVAISVDKTQSDRIRVKTTAVAFFYLSAPNVYVCTDASDKEEDRWTIEDETIDEYRRRALRERSESVQPNNVAPGKHLEAEEETEA